MIANPKTERHPIDVILSCDEGILEVFVERIAGYLVFTRERKTSGEWYLWSGTGPTRGGRLWKTVSSEYALSYMTNLMTSIVTHYIGLLRPLAVTDSSKRATLESLQGVAQRLQRATLRAQLFRLAKEPLERVPFESRLNAAPHELPLDDGYLLDLRAGAVRLRERADLWTGCVVASSTSVRNSTGPAPKNSRVVGYFRELASWDKTDGMYDYLQRLLGHFCTGEVSNPVCYVWYGSGSNGKSTLARIVKSVLGDFAWTAPANLLTAPPSQIAGYLPHLLGKRVVFVPELDDEEPINAKTLALLTSGEPIPAKRNGASGARLFCKVVLLTTTLPAIRDGKKSSSEVRLTKRFLRIVPFRTEISEGGSGSGIRPNPGVFEEIVALKEEVLAWMVEGARRQYHNPRDLEVPVPVLVAVGDPDPEDGTESS